MDDFLFLFATRELARMGAAFIDATLTALGLKRSIKKSVLGTYAAAPALGVAGGFPAPAASTSWYRRQR
jgi:hypothetical protein